MLESPFVLWFLWNLLIAIVIASFVFLADKIKKKIMPKMEVFIALSVGLILSVVFLGFIPEVVNHGNLNGTTIWILLLSWIAIFYILELFLHWHHCKDVAEDGHTHHGHSHENSLLIAAGTFFHNAIHGVVLFSAFSIDTHFWVATTFAILLHSVPQNIANLIMNHNNTRYVYIAALWGIFGAILVYPFKEFLIHYTFHILMIIAGALLYTAIHDMLPSFSKSSSVKNKAIYLLYMIAGVVFFTLVQSGEHEHNHSEHGGHSEVHSEHDDNEEEHNHAHDNHPDHDAFDDELNAFEEGHLNKLHDH